VATIPSASRLPVIGTEARRKARGSGSGAKVKAEGGYQKMKVPGDVLRLLSIMSFIVMVCVVLYLASIVCGCKTAYKGGKVSEGTDAFVGLNVPLSEGMIQFEILNYLSGFRFMYDKEAFVVFDYTVTNRTSFAGVYENGYSKTIHGSVIPVTAIVNCMTNLNNQVGASWMREVILGAGGKANVPTSNGNPP